MQVCIIVSQGGLVVVGLVAEIEHDPIIESGTVGVQQNNSELDISGEGYNLRNYGVTLIDARVNLKDLCNNESILVLDLPSHFVVSIRVKFKRYQDCVGSCLNAHGCTYRQT